MYDLVIRHGRVYDGTGAPPFEGDVAIEGDRIVAVGDVDAAKIGSRTEEIDATGRIVTPGFVDAHTHYDGQITWDPYVSPSTYHGVTTIVTGNCGVGFAPCRADQRDWLIGLMEGVEDIPGTALHAGIRWDWEAFPEYLDALERAPLAIDVGTQVPHGAVRAFVMGQRGVMHEAATPEEIEAMKQVVREAIEAGALGFSTSRTEKSWSGSRRPCAKRARACFRASVTSTTSRQSSRCSAAWPRRRVDPVRSRSSSRTHAPIGGASCSTR
jgi:N-acyl-D-amino-acid deacylase